MTSAITVTPVGNIKHQDKLAAAHAHFTIDKNGVYNSSSCGFHLGMTRGLAANLRKGFCNIFLGNIVRS